MRIAIISDLHLGTKDLADRFGHDVDTFCRFLDALERSVDLIVINGDLFETWQGARFARPNEALAAIRRAYPHLSARLLEPPYTLTWGNHDPILATLGAVRQLELDTPKGRILIAHGHRFDPPLKRTRALAYTFCWTTGWPHRRRDHPLARKLDHVRHRFEEKHLYNVPPQPHLSALQDATCPYQRGAAELLQARDELAIVAFGHTHVPASTSTPWGRYLNSGAIAGGRFDWIAIDTNNLAAQLLVDEPNVDRALDTLAQSAESPTTSWRSP